MIQIDGHNLTIDVCERVGKNLEQVEISPQAINQVNTSREYVDKILNSGKPVYGINTGFGLFSEKTILPDEIAKLNRNLIISHAVGTGAPFENEIVRAAMLIRANTLSKGYSGVRKKIIQTLLEMLNRKVTPIIPSQGSLGSSGDLCQLSHLALVLSRDELDKEGESGWAEYEGEVRTGKAAMQKAGIERIVLESKEGLALNNGATFSAAIAAFCFLDAERLLDLSVLALSLSLESLMGCSLAFDQRIHDVRGLTGQSDYADRVRKLISGSQWLDQGNRVQDAYSLRCAAQVCGTVLDTIRFGKNIIENELNAATDNPLIFDPGIAISGGNFHGEPVGLVMDYLKIAIAELCAISERRIYRLLDPNLNCGLPAMLVGAGSKPGLNSGLMMPHYTAVSLTLENQSLANPDSTRSLPASASQEDHNANSLTAARHAREVVTNTYHVLAIEILTACQAISLREKIIGNRKMGEGTNRFYTIIRDQFDLKEGDYLVSEEIRKIKNIIQDSLFQTSLNNYLLN